MELHDFLEKHSTEYSRQSAGMKYFKDEWRLAIAILLNSDSSIFDDALANYTDLICEKQREMCAATYIDFDREVDCFDCDTAAYVIESATQPKIYDLCEQ